MTGNSVSNVDEYSHLNTRELLSRILVTLEAMKQQEFDYWEAWKKAKTAEQNKEKETN